MKNAPLLHLLLYSLFTYFGSAMKSDSFPTRKLQQGVMRGLYITENGTRAEVYLGVPYAQPPVGKLRFEYPKKPLKFDGVYRATKPPKWCIQFWFSDPKVSARQSSEDCLYLNLYMPTAKYSNPKHGRKSKYPLLIWIHGGSYQVNGANMFPTIGTIRNLVSRNIAVAIVNYRLGPLGFFSTLNEEMPGNYGLEDQLAVLKWFRANGRSLGLDIHRVTVGGESAGAACASILATSDKSKRLFANVIMRSGSSMSPWAVRTRNTNLNSELMASWLGCPQTFPNNTNVKECLQNLSIEKFVQEWNGIGRRDITFIASHATNYNHPFLAHTYFTPVIDAVRKKEAILPKHPTRMIKEHGDKPALIGVTRGECAAYVMWLYFIARYESGIDLTNMEYTVPRVLYKNKEQVRQAVSEEYMLIDDANHGRAMVKIVSDQNFIVPAITEANFYAQNGATVFSYVYDYENKALTKKTAEFGLVGVGAGHGFDMVFLFHNLSVLEVSGGELQWSNEDLAVTKQLADTMANFVKFRNPKMSKWTKYEGKPCSKAMFTFTNGSTSLQPFFPREHTFWTKTIPVVDSLTYTGNYQHYKPMVCIAMDTDWPPFKIAFYVSVVVCALCILLTTICACSNRCSQHKRDSYEVKQVQQRIRTA